MVLDEEKRLAKRRLIEANRARKRAESGAGSLPIQSQISSPSGPSPPKQIFSSSINQKPVGIVHQSHSIRSHMPNESMKSNNSMQTSTPSPSPSSSTYSSPNGMPFQNFKLNQLHSSHNPMHFQKSSHISLHSSAQSSLALSSTVVTSLPSLSLSTSNMQQFYNQTTHLCPSTTNLIYPQNNSNYGYLTPSNHTNNLITDIKSSLSSSLPLSSTSSLPLVSSLSPIIPSSTSSLFIDKNSICLMSSNDLIHQNLSISRPMNISHHHDLYLGYELDTNKDPSLYWPQMVVTNGNQSWTNSNMLPNHNNSSYSFSNLPNLAYNHHEINPNHGGDNNLHAPLIQNQHLHNERMYVNKVPSFSLSTDYPLPISTIRNDEIGNYKQQEVTLSPSIQNTSCNLLHKTNNELCHPSLNKTMIIEQPDGRNKDVTLLDSNHLLTPDHMNQYNHQKSDLDLSVQGQNNYSNTDLIINTTDSLANENLWTLEDEDLIKSIRKAYDTIYLDDEKIGRAHV